MCVTLIDGLVMARSAFHHSMNYRSVVVLGEARLVEDAEERLKALRAIVDQISPERWDEVRGPSAKELARTYVLALPLSEASAKERRGPPIDDEEDYDLAVWAGEVPAQMSFGKPVDDGRLQPNIAIPPHLSSYERGTRKP